MPYILQSLICQIAIYPFDSIIHSSYNWALDFIYFVKWFKISNCLFLLCEKKSMKQREMEFWFEIKLKMEMWITVWCVVEWFGPQACNLVILCSSPPTLLLTGFVLGCPKFNSPAALCLWPSSLPITLFSFSFYILIFLNQLDLYKPTPWLPWNYGIGYG